MYTCFLFGSHEGAQLLLGFLNGKIRIHQLTTPYSLKELGPYWELGVHDSDYGHVTNLVVSYDNNVLLSTGADANIFVFIYMSQEKVLERIHQAKMMSPREKVSYAVIFLTISFSSVFFFIEFPGLILVILQKDYKKKNTFSIVILNFIFYSNLII